MPYRIAVIFFVFFEDQSPCNLETFARKKNRLGVTFMASAKLVSAKFRKMLNPFAPRKFGAMRWYLW